MLRPFSCSSLGLTSRFHSQFLKGGKLAAKRPTTARWWKPFGVSEDAIDSQTSAVRRLESEIYEQRKKFRDTRPESYGEPIFDFFPLLQVLTSPARLLPRSRIRPVRIGCPGSGGAEELSRRTETSSRDQDHQYVFGILPFVKVLC